MGPQLARREVRISCPSQLEELLNAAENDLRTSAICRGTQGILVTRRRPDRYLLELSDQVPYGLTYEKDSAL